MLMLLHQWSQFENHQDKGLRLKENEVTCAVDFDDLAARFGFTWPSSREQAIASELPVGTGVHLTFPVFWICSAQSKPFL